MLRLGILGLSMVAAMVVVDCGGRTPLQDDDLFGTAGSIATTGGSGTSTGSGTAGTVTIGGAGGGISTTTGVGGSTTIGGFGGTGFGTGGSVIVGTGGTTGSAGSGIAGSNGFGGFGGAAGSFVGTGGFTGTGGSGGGPNQVRRLINELPGTRPNMACVGCAGMCQGSAQCAANPSCVEGLACAASNCGMQNGNPGLACLAKCLGGDPQAVAQAIGALSCVYGTCGQSCTVGRMR